MKTRIFTLIMSLFIATMAFAYDAKIDGIYYNLDETNKTAEVTNYVDDSYAGDIIIPEKVIHGAEYNVTSIGGYAFAGCSSLTSITIPNSVTSIGERAFYYCSSLTSITIPNSVTSIGGYAFAVCSSLTSITIPNSVTSIGEYAFAVCSSLTSIDVDANNPNYASIDGMLYDKKRITLIACPGGKTEVSIPNSVTSIGDEAFSYCSSLTSVTIGNSVTSIGSSAFEGCSSLTSVTIGNSVTSIGEYTFKGCSSLISITIPNSVTEIGGFAFSGCSSLTSITIGNSVTSIGGNAFSGCSSLTSITIPNSVTSIGEYTFYGCSSLTSIDVETNNQNYASIDGVLYNKEITTLICCPAGKTSITIPNSVTSIGNGAFEGCLSLTSITIPNSVTSIGYGAFYGCSSLISITIPNSVTSIGENAFSGCSSLISITIPNSVTSIGWYTFSGCLSLTSITIPNSVTSIGGYTFSGCSSLTSITIQVENPLTIDEYTFKNVSRSVLIKVPCGSKAKYQTAEYWREFINYEEVPAGTLTVDVNDKTMGFATVTKPNSCTDDVAQVQAQALAGYEFVRWSDGATENPHILLVTEDMTITAEFRKIGEKPEDKPGEDEKHNNFIVESADKTQGNVKITIIAEAIEGFEFDHWSDGSTENPRVVTLDEDVELYAYFRVAGTTNVETSVISSASVYGSNGVLYVEGAETDYYVLDAAGRLIYSGRDAQLLLPRGVYVVAIDGEVEKIVL